MAALRPHLAAQASLATRSLVASRALSTSAPALAEQAIKKTHDHSSSSSAERPANPAPPPRAEASKPAPGAQHFTKTKPQVAALERRSATPPVPPAYSEVTKKIVRGIAWVMGYNSKTSTGIRVTSDLYDRCAERWDIDKQFWQGDCNLPPTYQSWFQVTNLHVMLLLLRFRALPADKAKIYSQELVNHFFIDAENRMRQRFGVQTGRLVKGYMKEMHQQHRGCLLAIDQAVAMLGRGDSAAAAAAAANTGEGEAYLAMTIWRNLFGAGWGDVGGVLSKVKGVDKVSDEERAAAKKAGANLSPGASAADAGPQLAQDLGPEADPGRAASPYAMAIAQRRAEKLAAQRASAKAQGKVDSPSILPAHPLAQQYPELAFPQTLSRLTVFFLRELRRLAAISDREVELGRLAREPGPAHGRAPPRHIDPAHQASVGAGEAVERSTVRPLPVDPQDPAEQGQGEGRSGEDGEGAGAAPRGLPPSVATFGTP